MSGITPPSEPATSSKRRQDPSIQTLRGIAVILMVAGHVIGFGNRGLEVGNSSMWHYYFIALEDIRMPLFTLISGYVYAMLPVTQWRQYPQLIKGKSRRLLLPLITVGALYYVLERTIPGTHSNARDIPFWHVYLFGFEHLWFLQSIFVIFLLIGILDSTGVLASRTGWAAITALAAVTFVLVHVPPSVDVFTISGAVRLLPFFLLGYGLRRHAVFDLHGVPALAATVAFAGVYTFRLLTILGIYHPDRYVDKAITITVGATALVLIYSARNLLNVKVLAWIGSFSFGIYLLHVMANAAIREALHHLGVHTIWVLFALGLVTAIAGPIVFQLLFRRVWFVQTFVLGERRSRGRHSLRHENRIRALIGGAAGKFVRWARNRSGQQRTVQLEGTQVEDDRPAGHHGQGHNGIRSGVPPSAAAGDERTPVKRSIASASIEADLIEPSQSEVQLA